MRSLRLAITALGLLVLSGGVGCSGAWRSPKAKHLAEAAPAALGAANMTAGITDEVAMRTAVARLVPLGSSLAEAEALMKAEGFDCSFGYNTTANQDYLRCTRTDAETLLVSHRWTVNFTYSDGRTTGMEVRTGLLGL